MITSREVATSNVGVSATSWVLPGLILLAFGPLLGCATTDTPLVVDLKFDPKIEPEAAIEGCMFQVGSVADERLRKNDLGLVGSRVVSTRDVMPWLQQAFETLNDGSTKTSSSVGQVSSGRLVSLKASLKKLYVHTLLTSISANVLVAVSYAVDAGPLDTRLYRGTETGVNWTGSADSVSDLLHDALAHIIKNIRADLMILCRAQKPA